MLARWSVVWLVSVAGVSVRGEDVEVAHYLGSYQVASLEIVT